MNEIYLFGDSAAQGIVLDESENYRVSRVGCIRLMRRSEYPIHNYAVHGYTVNQGLESFRNLRTEPGNICVIEFGGNDCDLDWDAVSQDPDRFHDGKTPLVDFMNLLKLFVREAKGRNLDPVLVTPLPIMSGRYYRWVSKRRDADRILKYLRNDPESISRWAMLMNVSRPSLHRELKKLEEQGIISCKDSTVTIHNTESLQNVLSSR